MITPWRYDGMVEWTVWRHSYRFYRNEKTIDA
jgi:hypothetical protein